MCANRPLCGCSTLHFLPHLDKVEGDASMRTGLLAVEASTYLLGPQLCALCSGQLWQAKCVRQADGSRLSGCQHPGGPAGGCGLGMGTLYATGRRRTCLRSVWLDSLYSCVVCSRFCTGPMAHVHATPAARLLCRWKLLQCSARPRSGLALCPCLPRQGSTCHVHAAVLHVLPDCCMAL
jgi:hypothetical protein